MVMLHLFRQAGYRVGVAHCNFQLRGWESDADEALVRDVCKTAALPPHIVRFETERLSAEQGTSIQVAARNLRYDFFQRIADEHGYQYIATAHHVNDSLETIVLNIVRGTGLDGLGGIPVKSGRVIRPMLFTNHARIRAYAAEQELQWREDSSNATDDYNRNFIRHLVIPRLKELNPSVDDTFASTIERITGGIALAKKALNQIRAEIVSERDEKLYIDRQKLSEAGNAAVTLWELLKGYGFNFEQCKLMTEDHQPGKKFIAADYRIILDRQTLILEKVTSEQFADVEVGRDDLFAANGRRKLLFHEHGIDDFKLKMDARVAQLDADKIVFPLVWRRWKPGDAIVPLGMNNPKKISDLLIDLKYSVPDKENVTVLQSGAEIVWVVGIRIHDHYKISDRTKRVLVIEVD